MTETKMENTLKNRFRGWFPQEHTCPNAVHLQTNPKTTRLRYIKIVAVFFGVFAADFLVMSTVNWLGLDSTYGNLAAGATAVLAFVAVGVLLKKPGENKLTTKEAKKAARKIAVINAGIVLVLLATALWVNPLIANVEVALGLWIALLAAFFLVNGLLIRNFKTQTGMEGACR